MIQLQALQKEVRQLANPAKAKALQRFFKTGQGEYAEGDVFAGLTVPQSRILAKKFGSLSLSDARKLLRSKIHEERLIALLILVEQFGQGEGGIQKQIVKLYLANTKYINNWDLVDLSAPKILGAATFRGSPSKSLFTRLARSKSLWERRVAMLATLAFIQKKHFAETLRLAKILLKDDHDLMHKAVGWMLREVGKRDQEVEEKFLKKYYKTMPRTMLRYAIERCPEKLRKKYLGGVL